MSTSVEPVAVARRLPGDLAMWFFILAELSVFALLILAFTVAQALHPQMFSEGRQLLDRSTGLAMTLSLLTAGLFAALAQEQVRQDRPRRGAVSLWLALLFASGYVGIKLTEYAHLSASGLGLERNTFFTLYWILTAFHFLHVLLGMVILGWLAERCRRRRHDSQRCSGLESGVLYWHMVDLVWVVLFPVVYVLD
ncbi:MULTISPECIES: cytochrome c oxidase subunit 3 family protein [unclassified Pseudomonas]|uniref:cytochrome c oxidase subunit 3 family protein n=1 Tax=unclassified Pseudomonas TaxID=196821 RepID=UPI0008764313|nr:MULTISPECIES: cytochrome c oxidase subunit 3 family protein [unclassified Pseudomonas]ROO34594.1 cytochrome-c oxidase [Pseudomonas sp. AF76]ROO34749.1 cytochrome-c oxidase [Pseudomonas sp. 7SR1]SCX71656.1 nitric oxide reductase NorE protein [Pseudomonas sp. NFACC32-1]SFW87747.1 nitric oxide reductase NorE protein [Pseudomonas sp. NFACC09-4]SFY19366.1 nitric oxide reductase NorE protein [Pseudomonas sp. NFACC47-1]